VLAHLPTGFAVIGDSQFLPGYCLLLSDDPAADRLADLPGVAGWRSWPIWIFWVRRFTSFVRGVSPDFAG
jgi:hypothetical protein